MKNKSLPVKIKRIPLVVLTSASKKVKPYVYTENDLGEGKLHEGIGSFSTPIKNKKPVHHKIIPGNFKPTLTDKVRWLNVEEDFNYAYYY